VLLGQVVVVRGQCVARLALLVLHPGAYRAAGGGNADMNDIKVRTMKFGPTRSA
jgi:hypothetical protein